MLPDRFSFNESLILLGVFVVGAGMSAMACLLLPIPLLLRLGLAVIVLFAFYRTYRHRQIVKGVVFIQNGEEVVLLDGEGNMVDFGLPIYRFVSPLCCSLVIRSISGHGKERYAILVFSDSLSEQEFRQWRIVLNGLAR